MSAKAQKQTREIITITAVIAGAAYLWIPETRKPIHAVLAAGAVGYNLYQLGNKILSEKVGFAS